MIKYNFDITAVFSVDELCVVKNKQECSCYVKTPCLAVNEDK